jgi:hypothetical protein
MASRAPSAKDVAGPTTADPKNLGEVLDRMPVDAPPKVYQAIAMVASDLGGEGIAKSNQPKEGVKFSYRSVDQVYAALNPLLSKHNLVILPRYVSHKQVARKTGKGNDIFFSVVEGEFDFVSTLDGSMHTVRTIGEAMDTSDKSTNKAMAVAFKYAAFITFCIPVEGEDNDPDAHGHVDAASGAADAKPAGKAKPAAAKPISEEEANTNYREAESLLMAATSMEELKVAWDKVKWGRIPKPWYVHLEKLKNEIIADLKNPPSPSSTVSAPAFDELAAEGGDDTDGIPFE